MTYIKDTQTKQVILTEDAGNDILWIQDDMLHSYYSENYDRIPAGKADAMVVDWLNAYDPTGEKVDPDKFKLLPVEFFIPLCEGTGLKIGWRIINCDVCIVCGDNCQSLMRCASNRDPFNCPLRRHSGNKGKHWLDDEEECEETIPEKIVAQVFFNLDILTILPEWRLIPVPVKDNIKKKWISDVGEIIEGVFKKSFAK